MPNVVKVRVGILLVSAALWPLGFNELNFLAGCTVGAGAVLVAQACQKSANGSRP